MRSRAINAVNKVTAPIRGYWFRIGSDPEKALTAWQAEPNGLPTEWGEMPSQRPPEPRRGRPTAWEVAGPALALAVSIQGVLLALFLLIIGVLWPYAVRGGFR